MNAQEEPTTAQQEGQLVQILLEVLYALVTLVTPEMVWFAMVGCTNLTTFGIL